MSFTSSSQNRECIQAHDKTKKTNQLWPHLPDMAASYKQHKNALQLKCLKFRTLADFSTK